MKKFRVTIFSDDSAVTKVESILKAANIAFATEPHICNTGRADIGVEYLGEIVTFEADDHNLVYEVISIVDHSIGYYAIEERRHLSKNYIPKRGHMKPKSQFNDEIPF